MGEDGAASPASDVRRLSLSHYLALVRKFDEFVAVNAGKTLYSADVARQLGVSVRTLHNAVVAIRGMSMHRYMRLRRLWSVRQQLLRGAAPQSIKDPDEFRDQGQAAQGVGVVFFAQPLHLRSSK